MEREPTVKERFSQHIALGQSENDLENIIAFLEEEDRKEEARRREGNMTGAPYEVPRTISAKKRADLSRSSSKSGNESTFSKYLRVKQAKSKSKSKAVSSECGICLSEISESPAKLECNHVFCFTCVEKWLKACSKCPFCRKQCKWMMVDGKKVTIQQKEQMEDEEPEYLCYVCNQDYEGEDLLICDACESSLCHWRCDGDLTAMPGISEQWYCHYCTGRGLPTLIQDLSNNGYELDGFVVPDEEDSRMEDEEEEDHYIPPPRRRR